MENSYLSMDPAMDSSFMDGLLLEGCWLETTDASEFLHFSPSTSVTPYDPSSFMCSPTQDTPTCSSSISQMSGQDFAERSSLADHHQGRDLSSLSRRWWIGPSDHESSVMERLVQAVKHIQDFTSERRSLIQLWVPVDRGGKRVLTTKEQPFSHDPMCQRLAHYREISMNYQFSAEQDTNSNPNDLVGLPGRVFLGQVPEWTPDVRFFKNEEYSRVQHAQDCDVRGTLAIPVFEQGSKICLGVIEVVMTTEMVKLRPELESICRALQAVDLRSTEVPITSQYQMLNQGSDFSYQAALPEIRNLLRCACETHKLPLAQTWVSCLTQSKTGCRHNNENYIHCVSTIDDACYVGDPTVREFHEACSEHHLLKGQGVVGEAFLTNGPCFSSDVSSYKKSEYPLSHHATVFGLHGTVAIRLRCIHTGSADFVLEFFLPKDCRSVEEQRTMLNNLSTVMAHVPRSLRTVTEKELEEEGDSKVREEIETLPQTENTSEVHQSNSNLQNVGLIFDGRNQEDHMDTTVQETVNLSRQATQLLPSTSSQEDDFVRIKVSYEEEKIRFRMRNSCKLKDLLWEIGKRFSIEDMSRYDLKYLDEENEWVLLRCDEDVEECVNVCRSFPSQTIKLLLLHSSNYFPERSSASGFPS